MLQLIPHHKHLIRSNVPEEHFEKMSAVLQKIVPEELYFEDVNDFNHWMKDSLPLVKWDEFSPSKHAMTISLLCLKSSHVSLDTLFLELLKQRLLPGREVSILAFNHMYFHHNHLSDQVFFICEATILLDSPQEWHLGVENLPNLAQEIKAALKLPNRAISIPTKKTLSVPKKAAIVQNKLIRLLQKFPHDIDESIFEDIDRFFVLASKEFLHHRNANHITRLIASIYIFRKRIFRSITHGADPYHFELRLIPTGLAFPFCTKPVLGCVIGIGQLKEREILEERHILFAIQKIFPSVDYGKGSCYYYEQKEEKIKCFYLELEKQDNTPFTLEEREKLVRELKGQLTRCIEKLVPSVFMVRNEEEVLRNILMLRKEISSVNDLPQIMISLDHQTKTDIVFTVLWVMVRKFGTLSLRDTIQTRFKQYPLICERAQVVGFLRKKHPIEAYVLQLSIPRDPSFLRSDLSLNFYLAREKAVSILNDIFGSFRDYNGGIIFKQSEMLSQLKKEFESQQKAHLELIDNFFYSISPIEKQATLPYASLKILLDFFFRGIRVELKDRLDYFMEARQEGSSIFIILKFNEASLKEQLALILDSFPPNLIMGEVAIGGTIVQAYIYEECLLEEGINICHTIRKKIEHAIQELKKTKTLRVTIPYSFTSLDPRLAGDEFTGNILRLLFEGLTRVNREGRFELGMAESILVSPDKRQYIFKLRDAKWSNGSSVSAYDFEYAWKKILSVDFKTSYAYFFYPIKNAKKAKEGQASLDDVGVKAIDNRTLLVELDFPTPYFLELTAHTIYSPVHHQIDLSQPNWSLQEKDDYVCNGGFVLKTHRQHQYYELDKNKNYWNADQIEIDTIVIRRATSRSAYQMFRKGEIDWVGPPFGPWDPIFEHQENDRLIQTPHMGVYWYIFNTQRFPFHNAKLRLAFALAIDRKRITQSFSVPTNPAYSPLTPLKGPFFEKKLEENLEQARKLFEQALQELGLTRKTFPLLTLPYAQGGLRDIAARQVKDQWNKAFDVQCDLIPLDWHLAMQKMKQGEFHIGGMLWRSLIDDPIYILNTFRYAVEQMNLSRWENSEYKKILELADLELNPEQRSLYLGQAHEMLIREIPILPIYYLDFRAVVKNHILPPSISPFGILDVKWTKLM